MLYSLDTKRLAENLWSQPKRELPDYVSELNETSTGAAYLFGTIIVAMLKGKAIRTSNIEMDRFDMADIAIFCDYLEEKIASQEKVLKPIFDANDELKEIEPDSRPINFL